ncbi:MAG TPA: hypothetical protein PLK40_07960 [Bacteroidaceae bacterium]|nr:hypothetical protein [Bacteroidaceae bacterium]
MHKSHIINILLLLTILAGFALQACSSHKESKYSIQYLDSLVNINPKTAYIFLKQKKDSTHTQEEFNRYTLYGLIAKDKLYVKHTNDSLPKVLIAYYNKKGNKQLLGLAYYMLGATYADLGDVPESVKAFLTALRHLKNNAPLVYTGVINNRIGFEYVKLGMCKEARDHYIQGFNTYLELSDSSRMENLCRMIGKTYISQKGDSMIYWYKRGYSIAQSRHSQYGIFQSLMGIVRGYLAQNDRINANNYLNQIDTINLSSSQKDDYYFRKGEYYYTALLENPHATMEIDSAIFFLNKLLKTKDLSSRSLAAYYLSRLANKKNDYKTAFNLQRKYLQYSDSLHSKKILAETAKIEKTYNYKIAQKEKEQAESKARTYRYYIMLISLLSIATIAIILLTIRWKSLQIENEAFKDFALIKILSNIGKNKAVKEENASLTPMNLQEEGYNQFIYNDSELAENYKHLRNMLEMPERTIKDTDWKNLLKAVDQTIPDFRKHINLLVPKISKNQQKYCYLTKLGFKQNEIALLIPMTESGVSQLKKRLVKKVGSDKVTTKNLTETIQNL